MQLYLQLNKRSGMAQTFQVNSPGKNIYSTCIEQKIRCAFGLFSKNHFIVIYSLYISSYINHITVHDTNILQQGWWSVVECIDFPLFLQIFNFYCRFIEHCEEIMTIMGGRGELVITHFHCHLVHAAHSRPEYSEILFHAR